MIADIDEAIVNTADKNFAIDLNGKTWSSDSDVLATTAGTITINATNGGTMTTEAAQCCVVWAKGGDVVINGGTFVSKDYEEATIYVSNAGSVITINGGTFENTDTRPYRWNTSLHALTLNVKNNLEGQHLVINGGTFIGNDPQLGDDTAGGTTAQSSVAFVSAGYVAIQDGSGNWVVQEGYNVTFETERGDAPEAQRIAKGELAVEPADPVVVGWGFDGWFAAGAATAFDFTTPVEEDLVLTAQWSGPYVSLSEEAFEVYPNCSNVIEVVNAPAGATFKWTFAGEVANASGATDQVSCAPYGKAPGTGTATVDVSVNDTVVTSIVATVTVKNVVAVLDETEYANLATAVAAAIAGDKVLGVYTSDGTVTLVGGQTLKVRSADNRGVGGVTVFTDLAQFIVTEFTDAGVTTYVCTADEVNNAIAGVAGLDTATAAVNGPAPITKIEVSEFATDAQNCLGWKITFTPVLGTGVDLAGWVRATIANEKIAVKHAASVADLVSGQNVTESAVKGAEHLEYVDYDTEAGTVTVVVPVPDTTANNAAQFFRLVIKE